MLLTRRHTVTLLAFLPVQALATTAVAQGRDAAEDMHIYLMGGNHG